MLRIIFSSSFKNEVESNLLNIVTKCFNASYRYMLMAFENDLPSTLGGLKIMTYLRLNYRNG